MSDANDGDARGDEVEAAMPLKGAGRRPRVEEARESRRDSSAQTDESDFIRGVSHIGTPDMVRGVKPHHKP